MMLDQFDKEIAKVDLSYAKSKNLTVTDVVIIASIPSARRQLSREYPLVVVGHLQPAARQDATRAVLDGALHDARGHQGPQETRTPKVKTPYNTYELKGLPVGPICNPGLKALEAAAHPAPSEVPLLRADRQGRVADVHDELRRLPQGEGEVQEGLRGQVAPLRFRNRVVLPIMRECADEGAAIAWASAEKSRA